MRLALAFILLAFHAHATIYTVCASGCTSTTVAGAIATAGFLATDDVDVTGDITEAYSLTRNVRTIIIEPSATWRGNGTQGLTITNTMNQAFTVTGGGAMSISLNGSSIMGISSVGANSSYTLKGITLSVTAGGPYAAGVGMLKITGALAAGKSLTVDGVLFKGNGNTSTLNSSSIRINTAQTVASAIVFKNNIFAGHNIGTPFQYQAPSGTEPSGTFVFYNNTIDGCAVCLSYTSAVGFDGQNILCLKGGLGATITGAPNGLCGMIQYSAFEGLTYTCGTNSFVIANPNYEVVDPTAPNYNLRLLGTATSRNTGATLAGTATDYFGNARPAECCYDIGAIEFVPPLPPCARKTFTKTKS